MKKAIRIRKFLATLLCAAMFAAMIPELSFPAKALVFNANSADLLKHSLSSISNYSGEHTINLTADIYTDETFWVECLTANPETHVTVTINGNGHKIAQPSGASTKLSTLINVGYDGIRYDKYLMNGETGQTPDKFGSVTLVLNNVVLDGALVSSNANRATSLVAVKENGNLTVGPGTKFMNAAGTGNGAAIIRAREWFYFANRATSIKIQGTEANPVVFSGNSADLEGGAIFDNFGYSNSSLSISHARFENNAAKSGAGGAIYKLGKMSLDNATFTGNSAAQVGGAGHGGAVYNANFDFWKEGFNITPVTALLTMSNVTVEYNEAGGHGGGIFAGAIRAPDGSDTIDKVIVRRNKAGLSTDVAGSGGGIYCTRFGGPGNTLSGVDVSYNSADGNGGGIYGDAYAGLGGKTKEVTQSGERLKVTNNTAKGSGGGLYSPLNPGNPFETGGASLYGLFEDNEAGGNGGGIYIKTAETLNDVKGQWLNVTGNKAGVSDSGSGSGGGIYIESAKATAKTFYLYQSTIANNTATSDGGGVYDASSDNRLRLDTTVVSGNTASGQVSMGGGIYKAKGYLDILTAGTEITGNTAFTAGGVYIAADVVEATIAGARIMRNSATSASASSVSEIYREYSEFPVVNFNSGLIFGYGDKDSLVYNIAPRENAQQGDNYSAAIIAWNRPQSNKEYSIGSSEDLTASSSNSVSARWALNGIAYSNSLIELTQEEANLVTIRKLVIDSTNIQTVSTEVSPGIMTDNQYPYGTGVPDSISLKIKKDGIEYGGEYTVYFEDVTDAGNLATDIPTLVGTYNIYVSIEEDENFEATSDNVLVGSFEIIIDGDFISSRSTTVKTNLSDEYGLNLSECIPKTVTDATYEVFLVTDNDNMLYNYPSMSESKLIFTTQSFSDESLTASIVVRVKHSENQVHDITVNITATSKDIVKITATPMHAQYSTYPHTGLTGDPVFTYKQSELSDIDYTVTYKSEDTLNDAYSSSTPPTDAGRYSVTIAVADDDKTYAGSETFYFRIDTVPLTVKANDVTVSYGALLPDVTVRYDGLLGNDTADDVFSSLPVAAYTATSRSSGGYIVFDSQLADGASYGTHGALARNYSISYIPGTLSVTVVTIPDYQLTAVSPVAVYGGSSTKTLTLSGNKLDETAYVTITKTGGAPHEIELSSSAVTVNSAGTTMTVKLSDFGSSHPYTEAGEYKIQLATEGGSETAARSFSISNNEMYSQDAYAILAVTQNASTKQLAVELYNTESQLKSGAAGKNVIVTLRGRAIPVDGSPNKWRVIGNTTLNKVLGYASADSHPIIIELNNGDVTISSDGYVDSLSGISSVGDITNYADVLTWQGMPISTCGFKIVLDNEYKYRNTRLQDGTYTSTPGENGLSATIADIDPWRDVVVARPSLGSSINLYVISADLKEIHLFDGEFSAKGGAKLNLTLPDFITPSDENKGDDDDDDDAQGAKLQLELKDIVLGEKTGFPEMWLTGKGELNLLSLIKGEMNIEINSLPETYPSYFGMKGQLELKDVIYLEGEFVFTYQDGVFMPEKLEFFARGGAGIPLLPPVVVATAYGFGGGVDGISRTVYGNYGQVPPISIKAMAAVKDITGGLLFDVKKATFTFGPSEISFIANEVKFMKILTLNNYGWKFGLRDSNPPATLPDPYMGFSGSLGIKDLKAGPFELEFGGSVALDAVLHSYYLESEVKNLFTKLVDYASGKNVSWTEADSNRLATSLLYLIDAEGTAAVYAKLKLWSFEVDASAQIGLKKAGATFTLSGALTVELNVFGIPIPYDVSFTFSINVVDGSTDLDIDLFSLDLEELTPEDLENLEFAESFELTNVRNEGSFTLGGTGGGSRLFSTGKSLTFENDELRLLSLSTSNNSATFSVTVPDGITIDFDKANADALRLGVYTSTDEGFIYTPVWTYNNETRMYEGGLLLAGEGIWEFSSEDDITITVAALSPVPHLESVTVYDESVTWTYDDTAQSVENELHVNIFLLDADEKLVQILYDTNYPLTDDRDAYIPTPLSEGRADITMPSDLSSGDYIIQVQMLNSDGETLSVQNSEVFSYMNPEAPGSVVNVAASYEGNGAFMVSWDEVSDADGYTVTILDESGDEIDGIAEIDVTELDNQNKPVTSTLVGGGMVDVVTVDPDTQEEITTQVGLPFGEKYTIRVRAYALRDLDATEPGADDVQIKLHGAADSTLFDLPVPETPTLTVEVDGDVDGVHNTNHLATEITSNGDTIYVTNDIAGNIRIGTTGAVNWMWEYEDIGAPQYDATDGFIGNNVVSGTASSSTGITIPIPDIDGIYTIIVTATNSLNDTTQQAVNVWVDTAAPLLEVDDSTSEAEGGEVMINGLVEFGSTLLVDGVAHATDTDSNQGGLFSVQRNSMSLVTTIALTAIDTAGNTSGLSKSMMMSDTGKLTGVELALEGGRLVLGKGMTEKLELWAIYENGKKYIIDSESDVAYSIVSGGEYASLIGANMITAGNTLSQDITVQADWKLDDENTLSTQLIFNIGEAIDAKSPSITAHPQNAAYTKGAAAQALTVAAISQDGGTLSYQWYESLTGLSADAYLLPGATSFSYTPDTSVEGVRYYYCVVTNTNASVGGKMTATSPTSMAMVTVNAGSTPPPTGTGYGGSVIKTSSGAVITLHEGSTVSADGTIIVGAGGATVTLPGSSGIILNLRPGVMLTLDDSAALGYSIISSTPFIDTPAAAWYAGDVLFAYAHKLLEGVGADRFSPDSPMTRGMLVTVLYRLIGEPQTNGSAGFTDVSSGLWYSNAVAWASVNGIVNGYGDGTFGPDDYITREQMVTIFTRFLNAVEIKFVVTEEYIRFTDEDQISDYAKDAFQLLYKLGIVQGVGGGDVSPKSNASRAQVAAIVRRFIEVIGTAD